MNVTPIPDLLATIVAAARTAAAVRERERPVAAMKGTTRRDPQGSAFADALRGSPPPRVIAECKRRSPSRGILRQQYDPAAHAVAYAAAGAAAISVLTEPTFFDGAPSHLTAVRAAVTVPLLRKDFIVTAYQVHESVALGADAVLLIAGALDGAELRRLHDLACSLGLAALVEVHTAPELERALEADVRIIGVNSRDLRTLQVDLDVVQRLADAIPDEIIAVAESGIRSGDDLRRFSSLGYDAFLVGERLIVHEDPGAALRALRAS
ncbi:MAG TPA: indole-3-glycerol phosphate synthase TrpC [Vicinamibacterales bacterium]|nr:indole-3-glycerol phosphate synthase TrpC [Vicinamibacterales bacterium]